MQEMIMVTIKYHGLLREITGKDQDVVQVEKNATIEDLLRKLAAIHGQRFQDAVFADNRVREDIECLINGKSLREHKKALGHLLTRDAVLALFPLVSGG